MYCNDFKWLNLAVVGFMAFFHQDVLGAVSIHHQPSTVSTLHDKIVSLRTQTPGIVAGVVGNVVLEPEDVSVQRMCALVSAATVFTNNPSIVIVVRTRHENLLKENLRSCRNQKLLSHHTWRISEDFDGGKKVNLNMTVWLNNDLRKFLLFCSLEDSSLVLGAINKPQLENRPMFFIIQQKLLYILVEMPELVVAIEKIGSNQYKEVMKVGSMINEDLRKGNETFGLYALNKKENKWRLYGTGNSQFTNLFQSSRDYLQDYSLRRSSLGDNLVYNVVTIAEAPYTMIHAHSKRLYDAFHNKCQIGRVCWQYVNRQKKQPLCCVGYLMDMLDALESDMLFESHLYLVEDGKYGEIVNGSWVGMVGDLASKKADIVLASLTINAKRSKAVDYSFPFLVGGMTLITLYKEERLPFLNIEPFKTLSANCWLATIAVSCGAVILLILTDRSMGKFYIWRESFTYVMGLLFQRDMGGKNPTNLSSKTIAIAVALFTLVVMSTYTAVLTANNVTHTRRLPISGFKDHLIQNPTRAFRFGTVANSAYTQLFRDSDNPVWNRMAQFMKQYDFTNTTKAFEQLANGELQAIIHDYYIAYHHLSKDQRCRFRFAGPSIKDGGSGIAVQKGSALAGKISQLILTYQAMDFMLDLQDKWMDNQCVTSAKDSSTATKIGANYFGGLFIGLLVSVFLSFCILLAELLVFRVNRQRREK